MVKEHIVEIQKLYRHNMMMTGFLKSTIATLLISAGAFQFFIPFYTPSGAYPDHTPYLGLLLMIIGFGVYYAGDIYNIAQNKKIEEVRLNTAMKKASDIVDEKMELQKKQILLDAEKKKIEIDSEVTEQLKEMKEGVCHDLRIVSNGELTYCSDEVHNPLLEYIRYPDSISASEIIKIGIDKFRGTGEEVTIETLLKYCYQMFKAGLITKKKLDECATKLEYETIEELVVKDG